MENNNEIKQMTLEEKVSLCSGKDFWHLEGIERLGLEPIMVTDGPHGLRKQGDESDHLGLNNSVPSTCFPTASATASSFDRNLMRSIGEALGEECLQEGVSVLLGPGANIKRSPLCGRNFEYISEDPYVTGEIATALINGVQSKGIGTSLKHFAANNQEQYRMTTNSVIDERALREIYLAGFEAAVKNAKPWTVMCSYNRLNGFYSSENKTLLTDILRSEWGFDGLVMTDWGASNDRVEGIKAGLDLQMPGPCEEDDKRIAQAVKEGTLDEFQLDKTINRTINLIKKTQKNKKENYIYAKELHHSLARRAATESAVLLKNSDNILPINAKQRIAVIGEFAKQPRYQGAGSSKINPIKISNAYDAITSVSGSVEYAQGYCLKETTVDNEKIAKACEVAKDKDIVLIFAGLPDDYESEGFDRTSIDLPDSHNALIQEVLKVNKNVVVVLMCGSAVCMPWADKVKGILLLYLSGQAGGEACADLLYGTVNPSGKLAETFPLSIRDCPSYNYFPGTSKSVEYRESIFVGYRYFDTVKKPVAYPFGYGLSYTTFAYSDLRLNKSKLCSDELLEVEITITNTGKVSGAEVVQLYVSHKYPTIYKPEKELKGFEKVFLQPDESKTISFTLDSRSFSYYNTMINDWAVESGNYEIQLASSSRDIRMIDTIEVIGDGKEGLLMDIPAYKNLPTDNFVISDKDFTTVYGRELPPNRRREDEEFTINSTIADIKDTPAGKQVFESLTQQVSSMFSGDMDSDMYKMMSAMLMDMPLRGLAMLSNGEMSHEKINGIVAMLNSSRGK